MGQLIPTQIIDRNNLKLAVDMLRQGKLVAFPTETVFGLGAIATNEDAVNQVFKVKGRPSDNPLIVHVSEPQQVYEYVTQVGKIQEQLMELFWPGPLSIIFDVKDHIFPSNVSGGGSTIAMRMPAQIESLLLIKMLGIPIVGPSANLSGKPSPTQLDHVLTDFNGKIAGIIDPHRPLTDIGVESTVVKIVEDQLYILRPGAITASMIEEALGLHVYEMSAQEQMSQGQILSPGVKYKHYSPKQPVLILPPESYPDLWQEAIATHDKVGILADDQIIEACADLPSVVSSYSLGSQGNIKSATQHLYAGLRALELTGCQVILAQSFVENSHSHAYMNRLNRAGSPYIKSPH